MSLLRSQGDGLIWRAGWEGPSLNSVLKEPVLWDTGIMRGQGSLIFWSAPLLAWLPCSGAELSFRKDPWGCRPACEGERVLCRQSWERRPGRALQTPKGGKCAIAVWWRLGSHHCPVIKGIFKDYAVQSTYFRYWSPARWAHCQGHTEKEQHNQDQSQVFRRLG